MKDLSRLQLSRHPSVGLFLIIGFSCLCLAFSAQATNPLKVIINEIAWMGTKISYNDEWIELYNNSDSSINLEGWILKAADGTPKINLTGTIARKSFYLLERTDDNTVPDTPADQIYTGALGNTGEKLELYDGSGNLIDLVNCSSGWFAGDNSTKQTMERKNPQLEGFNSGSWQMSQNPGGTPRAENSPGAKSKEGAEAKPLEEEFTKAGAKKELATVSAQLPEGSKSLSTLLIALPIAIFSGIIILFIKRKVKIYNKSV